jgi:enterochelin esterase-like enzyme
VVLLVLAALAPVAGAAQQDTRKVERTITIHAVVPDGVGTVYLTGNLPELGPWDPHRLAMTGTGRTRTAVLRVPDAMQLEYKFTLGSWDRESLGPSGTVMPNYRLLADADKEVTIELVDFKKETAAYLDTWKEGGVLGRLEYWRDVPSKYLTERRNVEIWLPPGYDEDSKARYPVLYMHDGQNLFDPRIANTGVDWGVDEAVVRGIKAGRVPPLIVVGVWCTAERLREYSPWDKGPGYARFLVEELMPEVNRRYRTLTGPRHTGVMGSSMGGLISFWLCWTHPEVFGRAGCVSTHWPWNGRLDDPAAAPLILGELASGAPFPKGVRLYFDFGTVGVDAPYEPLQAKVTAFLTAQGLTEGKQFVVRKFEGATHNEAAWRARLDEPLAFLWSDYRAPTSHARNRER